MAIKNQNALAVLVEDLNLKFKTEHRVPEHNACEDCEVLPVNQWVVKDAKSSWERAMRICNLNACRLFESQTMPYYGFLQVSLVGRTCRPIGAPCEATTVQVPRITGLDMLGMNPESACGKYSALSRHFIRRAIINPKI